MMNNADKPAHPDNWDANLNGLTKREYFAAMAMQGFCGDSETLVKDIANQSVNVADALLKELEK